MERVLNVRSRRKEESMAIGNRESHDRRLPNFIFREDSHDNWHYKEIISQAAKALATAIAVTNPIHRRANPTQTGSKGVDEEFDVFPDLVIVFYRIKQFCQLPILNIHHTHF